MDRQDFYMHRCLELASLGTGAVAPNPMVGALLVHQERIIGEGYHEIYGGPHAEVNCLASVKQEDENLVKESTLYVSLEPCAHHGKTPPCAALILEKKIPQVVIGIRDPFAEVNGKGIGMLKQAGVQVTTGILQESCRELNKRFFTYHTQKRPYVLLKWAQSLNGMIAAAGDDRLIISNPISDRLVHKWRSEEAAIMVGTNTALLDNPSLTNRLWYGNNPLRVVIDLDLKLPASLKLMDGSTPTLIFNRIKEMEEHGIRFCRITDRQSLPEQIMERLYELQIQSVMIEGGAMLLQSFINEGLWDEARVITNSTMLVENGLAGPVLKGAVIEKSEMFLQDNIQYYIKK